VAEPFVTLDGVDHAYAGANSALAVEGLSISVNQGEFAAVVGPSGCGKSTLMKLATGLQFPRAGTVTVAGQKVTAPVKIAGMAFQAPTLLPWRTTLENLLLPLEIVEPYRSEMRRRKIEFAARAKNLLTSVGLHDQGEKFPWELSGGMQQRTSLCRALIHEPQLLMLDEPFGALDAFTREELWCVIRDLQAARKITVILVTHDLREAVFLADRVFVMSQRPGRIVVERKIELPRPRDIEVTFTPEFTEIVQELRAHIVKARQ
jgi:NitT/TauT family transport system ATP-binding protein